MGIPEIREGTFHSVFNGSGPAPQAFSDKIQANPQLASMISIIAEHFQEEHGQESAEMFIKGTLAILHVVDSEIESREMDTWLS